MSIDKKRKYVIADNRFLAEWQGCLLFWGHLTDDGEERSFDGRTPNIDGCERYTLDEILRKGVRPAVYWESMSLAEFLSHPDIVVEADEIWKLGLEAIRVWHGA